MIGFLITLLIIAVVANYLFRYINGVSALTAYLSWRKFNKHYNLKRFDIKVLKVEDWSITNYHDFVIKIRLNSKTERNYEDFMLLINKKGEVLEETRTNKKEFIEFVTA